MSGSICSLVRALTREDVSRASERRTVARRFSTSIDSTICEVHGHKKAGASYGYTKVHGYHPLLATRADTGEILHARMRKGSANTSRGANRFVEELIARVRSAGATGGIVVRVDSGFWSNKTIATLTRLGVRFTMTVRSNVAINAAIAGIAEAAWVDIDYTDNGGAAQVAECAYKGLRLIVRRTRLADGDHPALFPTWRHHSFLTNLAAGTVKVDAFHRHHAVVELAIRDLKENAGLDHVPSGVFAANGAWLACAVLAHNLCVPRMSSNPVADWVTQQARNLSMDVADQANRVKFLIRDRDAKFAASFDAIFAAEGTRIIRPPVRAPRANAICERVIGTIRRERLDRMLILGRRHLQAVLAEHVEHYNVHRPHRSLDQRAPSALDTPPAPIGDVHPTRLRRPDRLGGLIHEYRIAA
ncbi:IS1380 family transposase [Acidiferrimicrobium sp. IK]|uniref:IS1380 family transposase n=1 Tax=Acidiferrimicrobium sp. IK TaxID=2871700 RepID=UPI0021CB2C25|nr:IS1380 family transposase [Acidiferrimicrobium sp. IK]MCU4185218.1 IS1380 family transposase [Acidiferrimicrobium sp. IK]